MRSRHCHDQLVPHIQHPQTEQHLPELRASCPEEAVAVAIDNDAQPSRVLLLHMLAEEAHITHRTAVWNRKKVCRCKCRVKRGAGAKLGALRGPARPPAAPRHAGRQRPAVALVLALVREPAQSASSHRCSPSVGWAMRLETSVRAKDAQQATSWRLRGPAGTVRDGGSFIELQLRRVAAQVRRRAVMQAGQG